jgi:hypothetical protein
MALRARRVDETGTVNEAALDAPPPTSEGHVPAWEWVPEAPPPVPVIAAPTPKPKREGMPPPISLLLGLVAACSATVLWAYVGPTDERFAGFLAPMVGLMVGAAVRWRAVKSTIERPIMAVTITAVAVLVGQFAVERNLETGRRDLPTSADLNRSVSLVQQALEERPFIMLLWLAAIVVAGAIASQYDKV